MTETTDHPTPRAPALALTTTAALDEAARNDPAADSPPPANRELYDCLTAVLETWHAGGTLKGDSLRLTEHLAVELCAYLFQRFGSDADRLRDWLLDFGDQVARTQQHAHPAGPTAIEILSAVADDFTPRPDGTAGGAERERLTHLTVPCLGYSAPTTRRKTHARSPSPSPCGQARNSPHSSTTTTSRSTPTRALGTDPRRQRAPAASMARTSRQGRTVHGFRQHRAWRARTRGF
ncbi:hypothetical protein [Streptomyces olivaceoviridis]|uniref:hypothetical protein n=1 Tax=Streptomyces olivaceoviridis TaxID=1921 RepID=UPI00333373AA